MGLHHVSERAGEATEMLLVRGILTDDLRFKPMFCGSEFRRPPRLPEPHRDLELVLADDAGMTLLVQGAGFRAEVDCSPHVPRARFVDAAVPLRAGAAWLRLRCRGVDVAELEIGKPPGLTLDWREKKVARDRDYRLRLAFTKPAEGALLKIFFQWGPEQYVVAYAGAPKDEIKVSFGDLPGGKACELIASYASGMRTCVARSKPFAVPEIAPSVEILRPRAGHEFAPWHPVELEAAVRDRQRGDVPDTEFTWRLDGKQPLQGRLAFAGFLEPGKHEVELHYGKVIVRRSFRVKASPKDG